MRGTAFPPPLPNAGSTSTSPCTLSGCSRAYAAATPAPAEFPIRVAFSTTELIHQPIQQLDVTLDAVGIRSIPFTGHGPFGETKGRAVIDDDTALPGERLHDFAPGIFAGAESMQKDEHRLPCPVSL